MLFFIDFCQQIVFNGGDFGKVLMMLLENVVFNYVGKIWDKFFDQLVSSVIKFFFFDLIGGLMSGNNSGFGFVGSLFNGYKIGDVISVLFLSISVYV